jgi:hypothetical protein
VMVILGEYCYGRVSLVDALCCQFERCINTCKKVNLARRFLNHCALQHCIADVMWTTAIMPGGVVAAKHEKMS